MAGELGDAHKPGSKKSLALLIAEAHTKDSVPLSEDNGMFVVLEMADEIFPSVEQAKVDGKNLRALKKSDEILVRVKEFKTQNFFRLKDQFVPADYISK